MALITPYRFPSRIRGDAGGGGGDGTTTYLIHLNEADGTTGNVANTVPAATNSVVFNDAEIDTTEKKFGAAALKYLPPGGGAGSINFVGGSPGLLVNGNAFTAEWWFYPVSAGGLGGRINMDCYDSTGNSFLRVNFIRESATIQINLYDDALNEIYDAVTAIESSVWTADAWHYFAFCYDGTAGTAQAWVDGVRQKNLTGLANGTFILNELFLQATNQTEWADEVRFSSGARYTGASIPIPTGEFT